MALVSSALVRKRRIGEFIMRADYAEGSTELDEDNMTVWHFRGYTVRFKNDGTQYYEIRRHGEKVASKPSLLEAVQWINREKEVDESLRIN